MDPTVRKGAIREGYIGEAGGGDLEILVIGHHEVFHDAFGGAHDIHGISCLIGTDTEEMLGGIDGQQVHELLGLDVIVLDEGTL